MNPTVKKITQEGLKKIPNFNGKTILAISATIIALLAMTATAEAGSSPSWTKFLGEIWANDRISDSEFLNGVQYLVNENVIQVDPRIVEIEVMREAQAAPMPKDQGKLWASIGALQQENKEQQDEIDFIQSFDLTTLQDEDKRLQWEIDNNMIGAIQYNELGNMIGDHEVELIELRAEVHDLKLQLGCLIDAVKQGKQADCSQGGMTT